MKKITTVFILMLGANLSAAENIIRTPAPIALSVKIPDSPAPDAENGIECIYSSDSFYTYRRRTSWPTDTRINGMHVLWQGLAISSTEWGTTFGPGRSFDKITKDGYLYTPGAHISTTPKTWPTRNDWKYEICREKL